MQWKAGERHVRLAAKLYECRDAMRTLYGEQYAAKIAEGVSLIRDIARRLGVDEISVAVDICKSCGLTGGAALSILAAAVEAVEPSAPPEPAP